MTLGKAEGVHMKLIIDVLLLRAGVTRWLVVSLWWGNLVYVAGYLVYTIYYYLSGRCQTGERMTPVQYGFLFLYLLVEITFVYILMSACLKILTDDSGSTRSSPAALDTPSDHPAENP